MSFELHGFKISLVASADLSAAQFLAMTMSATGLALATSVGEHIVGILNDDPDTVDSPGELVNSGVSKWEASAAITRGVPVTVAASGQCVTAGVGNRVHGTALEAAGGAGEIIPVLLNCNGYIFA